MRMDEILKKKWNWFAAFFLCIILLIAIRLQESGKMNMDVKEIVYSSQDLTIMRNILREIFGHEEKPKITVSSDAVNEELLTFSSIKPYESGFLLTYEESVPIVAINDGLVVYTGHSKKMGKTISVFYEDDVTVTYGFVDSFTILPYTTIKKGESIGNKESGDLYIQIEKDGKTFDLEETLSWLQESIGSL